MTPDELRDFCLALPQATETFPFGEELSVVKTSGNGKIFALSALAASPFSVSLKCDPEESVALRQRYGAVTPGYHLNKKHWISIDLAGDVHADQRVPDDLVEQLIHDSHALVRPKVPRAHG
jgi:predicted DNA-binding protein (MmcQ/YjbR family)